MLTNMTTDQLRLDFSHSEFGGTLLAIYNDLKQGKRIRICDARRYESSESAMSRRIKGLKDIYNIPVHIEKVPFQKSNGRKTNISEYSLIETK